MTGVSGESSYQAIAPYYDWIMSHVEYDQWAVYLRRLWKRHGIKPLKILELGAGTCPFRTRKLYPAGSQVVYSDLSPRMLGLALPRDTEAPNGDRVAADARALPFCRGFDLCLMIYDAINYLLVEEELLQGLCEVRQALEPGGRFIFDVTTEANSRRHFEHDLFFDECDGCSYVRESWYEEDARVQHNDFTFFVADASGLFRRIQENHVQRVYPLETIRRLCAEAGFALEACYEGFTFREGRERSERVHFVLTQP